MEFQRPTNIIPAPWAKNGQFETIPATQVSSGRASWDTGFPTENTIPVSSGGIPANYQDFQGVLHDLSEHTCFQQTGGLYLWSSSIDYPIGAVVQGSDNGIYRALAKNGPNTTVANPVTDSSGKWTSFVMTDGNQTISGGLTVTSGATISGGMTVSGTISGTATSATSAGSATNASSLGGIAASGYVTTSGAQTISGTKTFNDNVTIGLVNPRLFLNSTDTGVNAEIHFQKNGVDIGGVALAANDSVLISTKSGSTYWYQGACLTLQNNGYFDLRAKNASSGTSLIGTPDGTLTWGGNVVLKKASGTIQIAGTTITKGTAPSGTEWQNLTFGDKDLKRGAGLSWGYQNTKDSSIYMIVDRMDTASTTNSFNVCARYYASGTTGFFPNTNGTSDLGQTNNKWNKVWAATGTIQTSDERLKSSINPIPDTVLDAWEGVQWKQFQFNDSVSEKGIENARLHTGLIAQRIDEVFKAQGLDAARYGLFCHDAWDAQPEEKDDNGNIMQKARPAGDAYSLRYEEALCMEAAYQRRRADRAEARITALEQRLDEMEAVLASLISPISEEQNEAQEGE